MKKMSSWIVVLAIIALSPSCTPEQAVKKETATKPPEHEKMAEEYMKGVDESKGVVVAKVNGADITLHELIQWMNRLAAKYVRPGQEMTRELDQKVKQEALDTLIFRELAIQDAVRQGLNVPPEQVEETLEKLKANMGSEQAFRKNLLMTGDTEESLKKQIERSLLFDMIADREILRKAGQENRESSIDNRKHEWEAELKKNAKIEITLEVEIKGEAGRPGKSEEVK